ncbi:MAG: dCTP deaminase [Candidatus Hodarchaeota archaeon]
MRFLKSDEIEELWDNLIYSPKQLGFASLDLTVKKIYKISSMGVLDFGGSEYQRSDVQLVNPELEDDPKFGWWSLAKGYYLIEYNEQLRSENCFAIIFPHQRLLIAGCFHSPFIIQPSVDSDSIQGLLIVGPDGIRIKENARISSAITFMNK